MLTTAVGVLAVTCGLARAWPQVARIVVRRDTRGVSALTWMLSLCAFISWEAIGMVEHITAAVVFNSLAILSAGAVFAVLVWQHALAGWCPLVAALTAIAASIIAYKTLGALGTSVLGVGISVSMFIPQALKVLRVPSYGVSVSTWWLAVVTSVLWTLYGVMLGKLVLIVPNVVMMPVAGIILWQSSRTFASQRS
jgi:uncharacterized protein with PQ loop repeat